MGSRVGKWRPASGVPVGKQVLRTHAVSFRVALYQCSRTQQKALTPGAGVEAMGIKCSVRKQCNAVQTACHFLAV